MSILGVLVVAPLWGAISAQLFLQAWLALSNLIIHLIGFVKGEVERKVNLLGAGASLMQMALFSALLYGGQYLLTEVFGFRYSMAENGVYWLFVMLSLLYMLPEIPATVRKSWRNATVAGSLEADTRKRKMEALASPGN